MPPDFGAAVLVVLHVSESGTSVLPQILDRAGPLPAVSASDGETVQAGRVYVAPPNHHLTLEGNALRVAQEPRENGHRPAVDPLFRSAALEYGRRMAAVVLTGARDDGTSGLRQVKLAGGAALVQDPDRTVHSDPGGGSPVPESHLHAVGDDVQAGQSSRCTCPDCGGVLWEFRDGTVERFRCSVGHAYSIESLFGEQAHMLESALWAAVRTQEDRVLLLRRMERQARAAGSYRSAGAFEQRADEAAERASVIREAIYGVSDAPLPDERAGAGDAG